MSFLHPWALFALLLVPVLFVLRRRGRRGTAFPPLQYAGAVPHRRWPGIAAAVAECLVAVAAVVALAGPFSESRFERVDEPGIDIVMVLDVSLSMLAEDFPPNRLAALQEIARDFLDRSGGHRVGIVIFAGDTYVQSPLTDDRAALEMLLDGVSVYNLNQAEGGGTAVGDALLVATEQLRKRRIDGRDQVVMLITDGESNQGIDPLLAARYAADAGIRIYAVGIGSEVPQEVFFQGERVGGDQPFLAALDDAGLQQLTQVAEGRYFRATDADALERVFAELSRLESAPLEARTVVRRRPLGDGAALVAFLAFVILCGVELTALGRPWR